MSKAATVVPRRSARRQEPFSRVAPMLAAPLLNTIGPTGSFVDSLLFGLSGPLGLALAICLAVNLWPTLSPGGWGWMQD
jgi:hypothetical protein